MIDFLQTINADSHFFHNIINKYVSLINNLLWQQKIVGNSKNAEEKLTE